MPNCLLLKYYFYEYAIFLLRFFYVIYLVKQSVTDLLLVG